MVEKGEEVKVCVKGGMFVNFRKLLLQTPFSAVGDWGRPGKRVLRGWAGNVGRLEGKEETQLQIGKGQKLRREKGKRKWKTLTKNSNRHQG